MNIFARGFSRDSALLTQWCMHCACFTCAQDFIYFDKTDWRQGVPQANMLLFQYRFDFDPATCVSAEALIYAALPCWATVGRWYHAHFQIKRWLVLSADWLANSNPYSISAARRLHRTGSLNPNAHRNLLFPEWAHHFEAVSLNCAYRSDSVWFPLAMYLVRSSPEVKLDISYNVLVLHNLCPRRCLYCFLISNNGWRGLNTSTLGFRVSRKTQ